MSNFTFAATAILAATMSLAAVMPAEAGRGHNDKHGRIVQKAKPGALVSKAGGAVNIVQNGNQNGVVAVANTGTTNITQNGDNNNLTVIQVTVAGRGKGLRPSAYGRR